MNKSKLIYNQSVKRQVVLPYPGEVFVKVNDVVNPEQLIARTEVLSIIPGYFDVCKALNIPMERDSITQAMQCEIDQFVNAGAILASHNSNDILAPYNGYVQHISYSNGYILLRHNVAADDPPVVIDVAKSLGLSRWAARNNILVHEGQEVVRGQAIAGDMDMLLSPIAGTITEISKKDASITISPYYLPTEIYSGIYGEISEVIPRFGATIATVADIITGVFGVRQEVTGKLVRGDEPTSEEVVRVFDNKITAQQLNKYAADNTVGIIAASIDALDLVSVYGEDVARGVTGTEELGCSLIVTEGFGKYNMNTDIFDKLLEYIGLPVTMVPETNIQTPTISPKVYLYHKNE